MVDVFKVYVDKGYGLFLQQEFSKKIDRVTIGFNRMVAVAFVFRKKHGQESPHSLEKVVIPFHRSPPGSSGHIFPVFFP
jgi:hypothetical protein